MKKEEKNTPPLVYKTKTEDAHNAIIKLLKDNKIEIIYNVEGFYSQIIKID